MATKISWAALLLATGLVCEASAQTLPLPPNVLPIPPNVVPPQMRTQDDHSIVDIICSNYSASFTDAQDISVQANNIYIQIVRDTFPPGPKVLYLSTNQAHLLMKGYCLLSAPHGYHFTIVNYPFEAGGSALWFCQTDVSAEPQFSSVNTPTIVYHFDLNFGHTCKKSTDIEKKGPDMNYMYGFPVKLEKDAN